MSNKPNENVIENSKENIPNNRSLKWFIFGIPTLIITCSQIISSFDNINKYFETHFHFTFTQNDSVLILEAFNILLCLFFLSIIESPNLIVKKERVDEISKLLRINYSIENEDIDTNEKKNIEKERNDALIQRVKRVNILASQIDKNISYFMWALIAYYSINFIYDLKIFESFNDSNIKNIFNWVENSLNFFSAFFIFLAFQIFYDRTLDDENAPIRYFKYHLSLFVVYMMIYTVFLLYSMSPGGNPDHIDLIFGIICGVYNALAMSLLFGRFTSMENLFKQVDLIDGPQHNFDKNLYHIGTIYILPIYAMIQPFFGAFHIFNDFEDLTKSWVYLIGLLGKLSFLYLFYSHLKHKWLHVYLHIIIANNLLPKNLIEIFVKEK